jgi:anti-anti-sigma factor
MTQAACFSSDKIDESTQVLTLDGKCDLSTALEVEQLIAAVLDAGTTEIIFDLRGVSSLGPAIPHVLFRGLVRTKGRSGRFVLVRPNAHVWALFERQGLDRAFRSFFELRDALEKPPNHG